MSCRRSSIGGLILTNYLKEIISFRYYNVMEESYLVDLIKKSCCFVSMDFKRDMNHLGYVVV